MKTFFLIASICLELIVVIFLSFHIYKNRSGILGVVSVNPIKKDSIVFNQTDELKYFYEPKPNTIQHTSDESPFKASYIINSDSLNSRYEYPVQKAPNIFRIITLGDSWTFGLNIDTKDNWPSKLEDKLNLLKCPNVNKFEVINLGVQGYDFEYAVARYQKRGTKYNPDLVVWLMTDFNRIREKMAPLRKDFDKKQQQNPDFFKLPFVKRGNMSFDMSEEKVVSTLGTKGLFAYQQKAIWNLSNYYQGPLVIVPRHPLLPQFKELISQFINQRKKTMIFYQVSDIHKILGAQIPEDGHPSVKGHEIYAEEIKNYLVNNNLIPCK